MAYNKVITGQFRLNGRLVNSNGTSADFSVDYWLTDSKSGQAVPNYKRLIRLQQNASSNYTRNVTSLTSGQSVYSEGRNKIGGFNSYLVGPYFAQPIGPFNEAVISLAERNLALSDFHDSLNDTLSRVATLPAVLEFGKSKALAGKLCGDLVDSTVGLKRTLQSLYFRYRNLRNGWKRFISDSSSRYLEWKFGISPVMSDLSSAFREMSGTENMIDLPVIRGVFRKSEIFGWYGSGELCGASFIGRESKGRSDAEYMYYLKLKPEVDILQRWSINPGSIPGAIWEVTPWSWLVDYFFNVQTFLNQWQYLRMPFVYGGTCSKIKTSATVYVAPRPHPTTTCFAHGTQTKSKMNFSRNLFLTIPVYVPQLNLAGPFHGSREWNIAALIGTKFTRF